MLFVWGFRQLVVNNIYNAQENKCVMLYRSNKIFSCGNVGENHNITDMQLHSNI